MVREARTYRGRIAAVILTIRDDESKAIWSRLGPLEEVKGRLTYHVARVPSESRELTVAVHRIHAQGTAAAQTAATAAIEDFAPQLIVLVGIAGAVPSDEFSLGDVIVATDVADLRVQALLPDGRRELSVHNSRAHRGLVDRLTNLNELSDWSRVDSIGAVEPAVPLTDDKFTGDPAWTDKVRDSLKARFVDRPRPPRYVTGEIGSQDALVKDPAILQAWLQAVRKVEAVEMEAAGVMEAADRTDEFYPVLVVRGLSDVVGYKRDAAWTAYACNTAAAFALTLLTSGRLDRVGPLRMTTQGEPDLPHVFISYTPDSDAHKARVLALADRLCSDAVDAWLDRYEAPPLEGWTRWRERQLHYAEDIIVVCTEDSLRRFDEVRDRVGPRQRLIPVVFSAAETQFVPATLAGGRCYVLDADYEELRGTLPRSPSNVTKRRVQSPGELAASPASTGAARKPARVTKKVLIVAANRDGDAALALGREIREIAAALRDGSSKYDVHILWAAEEEDLRDKLLDVRPHILHFCGHGIAAGPILEGTARGNEIRAAETFQSWLKVALKGIKVEIAVLNFCESHDMLDALAETAPVVIGPVGQIIDEDAIVFSSAFYMALAAGGTGSFAYSLGTSAVDMCAGTAGWTRDIAAPAPRVQSGPYGIRCRAVDEVAEVRPAHGARKRTFAFFASEPDAVPRFRPDRELRRILAVFPQRASLVVEQCGGTRPVDFLRALMTTQPVVVHLSGHGTAAGDFMFEHDRHGEGVAAPSHTIARVLTAFHAHIECAVLMFSHSSAVARELVDVLDCVIAVDGVLPDRAAVTFSNAFYQMLDHGGSYRDAFAAGMAMASIHGTSLPIRPYGRRLDRRLAAAVKPRPRTRPTR